MNGYQPDEECRSSLARGLWVYPQPVAVACGRILRSRSSQSRLDSILKGAEVLTRYVAACSLASIAARQDDVECPKLSRLEGNLSYGHFLRVVQEVVASATDHPLRIHLDSGFKSRKKGRRKESGPADVALSSLLELRNEMGHDLQSITDVRAETILKTKSPEAGFVSALTSLKSLLGLPLFVIEEQRLVRKIICARTLLLLGESDDPTPQEIEISEGLEENGAPYLAVGTTAIRLHPLLVWGVVEQRSNYRLLFADQVRDADIKYKTTDADTVNRNHDSVDELTSLIAGGSRTPDKLKLADGSTLGTIWQQRRVVFEDLATKQHGAIPWEELDADTLGWYSARISVEPTPGSPREAIVAHLLDGRQSLNPEELGQLVVLFGKENNVRRAINREMIDLRVHSDPATRWDDRVVSSCNVIQCLVRAVDFISRHLGIEGATAEGLKATSGTADYIAVREALINLFIHQDYSDSSAVAQVEIQPDRATFFNTGYSMVDKKSLIAGGKSQSRNPLIARALRLIGFAELAGSGLRALQATWRQSRRRPPVFESDRQTNTFSLNLDWRQVADAYNAFWKDRIGVNLTAPESAVLNLAADPTGIDEAQAASAAGVTVDEAKEIIRHLERQVLIERRNGRVFVADHLKDLVPKT